LAAAAFVRAYAARSDGLLVRSSSANRPRYSGVTGTARDAASDAAGGAVSVAANPERTAPATVIERQNVFILIQNYPTTKRKQNHSTV
jgi:hypothetical protein